MEAMSSFEDEVLVRRISSLEDTKGRVQRNGAKTSPRSHFQRHSSLRASWGSRKAARLADYFCGLKKKRKERSGSCGDYYNGSHTGKTPIMSKSNFYYSPSLSSSPSPTKMCPTTSPSSTGESTEINNAKLASIGSGEGGDETILERDLVQDSASAPASVLGNHTDLVYESGSYNPNQPKEDIEMEKQLNNSSNYRTLSYNLTVHLINGKNLVVKDKNGSSDPYVKVKIGEKTLYKTKVVYANLNPIWDESFSIPIQNLDEILTFKVIDYDWGSKDDFMGMCITNLRKVVPNGKPQTANLPLSMKGFIEEKPMGELSVSLTLTPRKPEEEDALLAETVASHAQRKKHKQTWSGMLTVFLIDINDLPTRGRSDISEKEDVLSQMPGGYSNVFAKLRLGTQKRRSQHVTDTTIRPEWLEQFDFYLYDNNGPSSTFEIEFFEEGSVGRIPLGCVNCDISNIQKDKTTEYVLNFTNGLGKARIAVTLTAFRDSPSIPPSDFLNQQYSLRNTLKLEGIRDVGHLTVKVMQAEGLRAADIGGKSDPFCVLELVNARVQTHTEYKTLTPTWNKTFQFDVHDITTKLEVTVYDEDRDHKRDFLGKINIPLWKVQNGEAIWYKLKNRNLAKEARGNHPQILLQMHLIWNPIRAAIRVTEPQEKKYNQPKPCLRIETFLVNMERLRLVLMDFYDVWLYIKSCLDWEYPERSIKALTFYLLTCYFFQPFFIPLFFLILWLRPWWRKVVQPRRQSNMNTGNGSPMEDSYDDTLNTDESDHEEGNEIKKLTLVEKFNILQDASGVLQEIVGEVAAICESAANTYRMGVPFIYWLFAITLTAATFVCFLVDFRYVAMIFGIHEFSRVHLRPWKKSTFEFYHMIRRVPHRMNLGDKLGINSVLKSIQQLKNPANKQKFWKRGKNTPPSIFSPTETSTAASSWYLPTELTTNKS